GALYWRLTQLGDCRPMCDRLLRAKFYAGLCLSVVATLPVTAEQATSPPPPAAASWRSLLEKVREQARQGNEAGAVTAGEELLQQAATAEEPQGEEYRAALEELAEVFTRAEFWDAA